MKLKSDGLCWRFASRGLVFGSVLLLLTSAQVSRADKESFLNEAPKAWKAAVEIRRTLNCTFEGQWTKPTEKSALLGWKTKVSRHGENTLVDNFNGQNREIFCSSRNYAFHIAQVSGTQRFSLKGVEKPWGLPTHGDAVAQITALREAKERGAGYPASYSNLFLKAAVFLNEIELGPMGINRVVPISSVPWNDERFVSIERCEEADDGSGHIIVVAKIQFSGDPLPALNGDIVTDCPDESMVCSITFDGSEWWLPVKGESRYDGGAVESWNVEYKGEHKGLPLIAAIERSGNPAVGEGWAFVQTVTHPEHNVDAEEFRLPFYGLPEPPEYRKSGSPVLYGFVGVGLVLLAFFIYRRRK